MEFDWIVMVIFPLKL